MQTIFLVYTHTRALSLSCMDSPWTWCLPWLIASEYIKYTVLYTNTSCTIIGKENCSDNETRKQIMTLLQKSKQRSVSEYFQRWQLLSPHSCCVCDVTRMIFLPFLRLRLNQSTTVILNDINYWPVMQLPWSESRNINVYRQNCGNQVAVTGLHKLL